jgi:HlyD family secretion protein
MPVEIGSLVAAGELLAQIDARDVKNQYAQALAALKAAEAKVSISAAQKERAAALFEQQVITTEEHEAATLDYANSQAQAVKARTDLDLAKQRLEDATVRAPISGTVVEQLVSNGQVISSATSSASGGTALLKMADLTRIRIRALVAESDIGNVRPGQGVSVTVDAFPQRTFQGQVEKIEPQAVVQQSVTMFPVLISLSNEDRMLLPGMNGEVSMLIDERHDVPAVPVDAVRTVRELPVVAAAMGLDPEVVSAEIQRQMEGRAREREARVSAGGDSARADPARADSGGAGRRRWRGGPGGPGGSTERGASPGGMGRGGSASGMGRSGSAGGMGRSGSAGGMGRGSAGRAQAVFVKTPQGMEPRLVRLGLSDFDYAQVIDGVEEGEEVVLLSVTEVQAKRTQDQNRIRERLGGGVPGAPGVGGGRGGGGGGGGGRTSGGGGR